MPVVKSPNNLGLAVFTWLEAGFAGVFVRSAEYLPEAGLSSDVLLNGGSLKSADRKRSTDPL